MTPPDLLPLPAAASDPVSPELLCERFLPQILRWCARLGGPLVDAEDAAHETMLVVIRRAHTIRDPDQMLPWVYGVTRRVVSWQRRKSMWTRFVPGFHAESAHPMRDPERDASDRQKRRAVWELLEQLDPVLREVLVLCDLEDRTDEAVAQLVGVPTGTVKSRLRRARPVRRDGGGPRTGGRGGTMTPNELLLSVRDESDASPAALRRVERRLGVGEAARVSRRLLPTVGGPVPGAEARVRARLESPGPYRAVAAKTWAFAGAAVAAALLLALLRPPPELPLNRELAAGAAPVEIGDHVRLAAAGTGVLSGTTLHPRVLWEGGRLDVEVAPHRGIDLWVETADARVRVVGTAFTVERDVRGTSVVVTAGVVEVTCAGAEARHLRVGEDALCWPTTAAGLLGRARRRQADGASADEVLETLRAADRKPAQTVLAGEILALRFELLRAAGRDVEALDTARAYRDGLHPERAEVILGTAATIAFEAGGCEAAEEWLARLDEATTTAISDRCGRASTPPR